jgi:hypothetical protein
MLFPFCTTNRAIFLFPSLTHHRFHEEKYFYSKFYRQGIEENGRSCPLVHFKPRITENQL